MAQASTGVHQNPFPVPAPAGVDFSRQSITEPNPNAHKGESAIYLSASFPHAPAAGTDPRFPKTAYDCFNLGLTCYPSQQCLGARPWDAQKGDWAEKFEWETFVEVDKKRSLVGSALREIHKRGWLGDDGEDWFKVGIWCGNRPEWQYVSLATAAYGMATVSLYDTLGQGVVEYCINHADVRIVFSSVAHIGSLLKLRNACPNLKVIVSVDDFSGRFEGQGKVYREWAAQEGIKLLDLAEVMAIGEAHPSSHRPPAGSDIASICYTSGTTGNPKGAVLSHHNLASAAVANLHGSTQGADSSTFSYLPLSHIYERFCEDVCFASGCAIGYSCGDNLRLLEDIQLLRPTHFVSVPRVLNRIYQALKAATVDAPGVKGKLLTKVFNDKIYNLRHRNTFHHAVYDRLLLKKVRAVMGGRVQFIASGSAPINSDVLDFLKVAFSCQVTEGYGQTENCGTAVKCLLDDNKPRGSCGPPQPGVRVKLISVPEMGYDATAAEPKGELCTKGGVGVTAYYKDEAKSAETFDSEGWLHSGDVATVDANGRFKIIDRVKNLVKLSQGEYVALEKVENTYALSTLLAQLYIHADSLEDHVVAIIIPDPEKFALLVNKLHGTSLAGGDLAELSKYTGDEKVIKAVAKELGKFAEDARLNGFERINENIHITLDQFTMDNDLLTPTFKAKRNNVAKKYKDELAALYARGKGQAKQQMAMGKSKL